METVEVRKANADRALAVIRQLVATAAHKAGESTEFFMIQMNYRALVPLMRRLMNGGLCKGCGHRFANELDLQIEYYDPPRHAQDWARLHEQNVLLLCSSCSSTKTDKPFDQWLDEMEAARLSDLRQ
jgi:hypothetical protein